MRTWSVPLARLKEIAPFDRSLSSSEAAARRVQYGGNDIVEVPGNPWLDLARDTAKDPMLWFFMGTGILYALVGQTAEAITLGIAILPLLLMDAFLHRRTSASIQGLKTRLATEAVVIRNEARVSIPAVDIVPGDLVLVSPGDMLPADGVFIVGENLQVEESALTGEAYPVSKHVLYPLSLEGPDPVVEEQHWGFAGTRLLTGTGRLRTVFTGPETHYGAIIQTTISSQHEITPLQSAIGRLVRILLMAAILLCAVLAATRLAQGYGDGLMLLSAPSRLRQLLFPKSSRLCSPSSWVSGFTAWPNDKPLFDERSLLKISAAYLAYARIKRGLSPKGDCA